MIRIAIVPNEVQKIMGVVATFTNKIRTYLESNTAIEVATLVDQILMTTEIEVDREMLIKICTTAINTCLQIQNADWSGVEGRLKRLGDDLSHLMTKKEHRFSKIIEWFEIVFNDLFGKNPS